MELQYPLIITSRLLPGVQVGDAFISVEPARKLDNGRTVWRYFIDRGEAEFEADDITGFGNEQGAICSVLSFLGACAEGRQRETRGYESENADLFPQEIGEWAEQFSDEIGMLAVELDERSFLKE